MSKVFLLPPSLIGEPEVVAMLQAFYSRSAMSIEQRLQELGEDVPAIKESLKKWYLGYGHDSIGDCGNVVVFFEGVSMLFAKALEDCPLFNGQETSTRFISFSSTRMAYPSMPVHGDFSGTSSCWVSHEERRLCERVQRSWIAFYERHIDNVIKRLGEALPFDNFSGITEAVWEASIKARAFDIMRAFLPAGTLTQFSFYGSMRTLRDSLSSMSNHPLEEIRVAAEDALHQLSVRYPSAFGIPKYTLGQVEYLSEFNADIYYSNTSAYLRQIDNYSLNHNLKDTPQQRQRALAWKSRLSQGPSIVDKSKELIPIPAWVVEMLNRRPKGFKVPYHFGRFGNYQTKFFIDFGSFRDVQRHRNCRMPLPVLTSDYGIHPWYLETLKEVAPEVYHEAIMLLNYNAIETSKVVLDNADKLIQLQYMHPMGMQVPVEIDLSLDQMFYVAELRSSKTVHPTLRPVAQFLGRYLQNTLGLKVYIDESEDTFVPYRGKQTITKVD